MNKYQVVDAPFYGKKWDSPNTTADTPQLIRQSVKFKPLGITISLVTRKFTYQIE